MTSVLDLVDAHVAYGPFKALFGVDLSIDKGEAVALLGANGAGKSTVARAVSGLVPLSEGRLVLNGDDMTGAAAWRIRRAGVLQVPEGRGIFGSLSVEENLNIGLLMEPRARRRELLREAFDRFELLAERRSQRAGTLSGGQQRLLALAVALIDPPTLLVADELSLGLAPGILDEIYASLAELKRQGTSLLIIEQQTGRALDMADRAVVLSRGVVAYDGDPSDAASVAGAMLGPASS
jgi:branched-chain amino acid transport system ATP-binding protein